jgi:methyltransferase (TIGR00027 family)
MLEKEPSRTALAAAAHRARHQVLEQGRVFADPLAVLILGADAEGLTADPQAQTAAQGMRFFIAARSQFAETALAAGVETRGVRQLVVLGAGLDTFAYRNPFADRLRVFEVDHPATQAWKRRRLQEVGVAVPTSLAFAPVDFERESWLEALKAVDFDPTKRTFFMWLGVVPYLTSEAVTATLSQIGALPGGAELVFDYSDPPSTLAPDAQALHRRRAARVAAIGEPFLTYFEPAVLREALQTLGFGDIEDLGPFGLVERYLGPEAVTANRTMSDGAPRPDRGGHVIFAATTHRLAGIRISL